MPDRPLLVHIPSLGKDLLFPVSFECHEELSAPFRIQLHLVGALDTEIPFEKLLGCPLGVELQHGGVTRFFHGVVEEFSEGERDQRQVHYFATVVPRLSLLRLRVRSRIFQWQNVKDILETVLADLNPDLRQLGNYPARQYCVQYQESDFAFASRLMEEEGIYYFFEHEQNDHRLVLVDAKTSNRNLPEQARVRFDRTASAGSHELVVSSWRKTQRVVCPKRVVRDYTFLKAEKPLEGARPIVDQVACGQAQHQLKAANTQTLEACDFPEFAKYFDTIDLGGGENKTGDFSGIYQAKDDRAELRAEEEASRALHIAGSGNCPHFLPGYLFSLQGHPHADDSYLLTSVIHRGTDQARVTSEAAASFQYTCKFECLPGSLQYRPARHTPRPCVRGLQTALVVTGGSEVSIDKHARVKVKFHWDRSETSDLNSSCWIRVGQVWAGKKWGAMFWPRKGHEVIVGFLDGDPDCPIIVGSVYNSVNVPPTDLPGNYVLAGIKSAIFDVDDSTRGNGIFFHDAKDEPYTHVQSDSVDVQKSNLDSFALSPRANVQISGSLPLI